jgi:hypothetical protein
MRVMFITRKSAAHGSPDGTFTIPKGHAAWDNRRPK